MRWRAPLQIGCSVSGPDLSAPVHNSPTSSVTENTQVTETCRLSALSVGSLFGTRALIG